jgi:hypothetical protein
MGRGKWKSGDTRNPVRDTKAYREAVRALRAEGRYLGLRCHFHRRTGYEACPGVVDYDDNHGRWGFTAHHLDKLMHGRGDPVDPRRLVVAHRGCNSRDGLIAQNLRRQGHRPSTGRVDGFTADKVIVDEAHTTVHTTTAYPLADAHRWMLDYMTPAPGETWQRTYLDSIVTEGDSDRTSQRWPQPKDSNTE